MSLNIFNVKSEPFKLGNDVWRLQDFNGRSVILVPDVLLDEHKLPFLERAYVFDGKARVFNHGGIEVATDKMSLVYEDQVDIIQSGDPTELSIEFKPLNKGTPTQVLTCWGHKHFFGGAHASYASAVYEWDSSFRYWVNCYTSDALVHRCIDITVPSVVFELPDHAHSTDPEITWAQGYKQGCESQQPPRIQFGEFVPQPNGERIAHPIEGQVLTEGLVARFDPEQAGRGPYSATYMKRLIAYNCWTVTELSRWVTCWIVHQLFSSNFKLTDVHK